MSGRRTPRDLHESHEDERNRVRALERHEAAVRARTVQRLVGVLVQRPEYPRGHYFHAAAVAPVSPRRARDWPDDPGGPSSDFEGCIS